ncbi:hypothetical protein mRhiFer1_000129 [Rhinolophus ferrumequinum]|uniref:Uncharacterized protein n=1 Tax=Rhinolophus ferrumequinum TaxID=59479 RepID=A0A7J7TYI5_RHIFE|nr:hypothetical protein mRhiFer1_000129 [Rhinolophus ferrumequinum]
MKRSGSVQSVAGTRDERLGETPEPSHVSMLGAGLRRPRRRLSTGPGLGWVDPEPLDPGVPLLPRPTTLPLLIPPRISITRADRELGQAREQAPDQSAVRLYFPSLKDSVSPRT